MGENVGLEQPQSDWGNRLGCSGHCFEQSGGCDGWAYIKECYPDLCSMAFVLECTQGGGSATGTFPEASAAANAFWGELLGLMVVHLLLHVVKSLLPGLNGRMKIYSSCLGALDRVAELPPYRIPSRCRHSDILKTSQVNCGGLTFHWEYIHVEAHQDNRTQWEDLTQAAQLNTACDVEVKVMLRPRDVTNLPRQEAFPLKPICLFVDGRKMTSDTEAHIR
jgi:hypothetical protein